MLLLSNFVYHTHKLTINNSNDDNHDKNNNNIRGRRLNDSNNTYMVG